MKTFSRTFDGLLAKISETAGKVILVAGAVVFTTAIQAQVSKAVITINSSNLTNPLVERWISEYSKLNPSQSFKVINKSDAKVGADLNIVFFSDDAENLDKESVNVARLAILPVVNEKNLSFSKELKKGIKSEELKQIFLKNDNESDESGKDKKSEPTYTVYTKTPQSGLAVAISNFLGRSPEDLNGVYVTGDDKYLITSVLEDTTGVTYNNLGLIYDLSKRTVISGIRVLPIDLNGNGKLDKEEQIYDNLDQVLAYLESSKKASVPTEYLSFTTVKNSNNPEIQNFINWVTEYGQEFNHQYGFLNIGSDKNLSFKQ